MRFAIVLALILSTFCWVREYPFPAPIAIALLVLLLMDCIELYVKVRR